MRAWGAMERESSDTSVGSRELGLEVSRYGSPIGVMGGGAILSRRGWMKGIARLFFALGVVPGRVLRAGDELSPELRLLKNIEQELVQGCLYPLTTEEVLAGGLRALSKELGPALSNCFPSEEPKDVASLVEAYQKALSAVMQTQMARDLKWTPVSLMEVAMAGFVRTLDPFSFYVDSASAQVMRESTDLEYASVGMETSWRNGRIFCFPFPSYGAERAGIDSGDELLEVDGWSVGGRSEWEVTRRLRGGGLGSKITLKVRRAGREEMTFTFARERIKRSASARILDFPKGVRVTSPRVDDLFFEAVSKAAESITARHTLCLDLRGNEGGDISNAVRVAELFLPKGTPICSAKTLEAKIVYASKNAKPFRPGKLLIFQDEQTASGAEVIIAALLGYAPLKCETRGVKTFGKGLLQNQIQVARGGILRFTSARIYGPAGEYWHDVGIAPNSKLSPDTE